MNLELIESLGQNYPEKHDGELDSISVAVALGFNKKGTILAVGCNDGNVVLWDFMTRKISKVINAHVHPVSSISWSRDGRKILTASTDYSVCILDVLSGDWDNRLQFPGPVMSAQLNPGNPNHFLASPLCHATYLLKLGGLTQTIPVCDGNDMNISSFDRRGDYIYTGSSKGKIEVYTASDLQLVASFKINGAVHSNYVAVKGITFSHHGEWFLINSADRIIRVYDSKKILECGKDGELEPIQKLQDLVNKTIWKKCCFSGDGEYICAGSGIQDSIYIWERSVGNLVKILHGKKGHLLLDVAWHPERPIITSISTGMVSIWTQNLIENWSWSTFTPDFKELDENVDYEERESEFDDEDEDKIIEMDKPMTNENLDVNVDSLDPVFGSSDEEGNILNPLHILPKAPEIENPEVAFPAFGPGYLNRFYVKFQNSSPQTKKKFKKLFQFGLHYQPPLREDHEMLSDDHNNDQPSTSKQCSNYTSGQNSDESSKDSSDTMEWNEF